MLVSVRSDAITVCRSRFVASYSGISSNCGDGPNEITCEPHYCVYAIERTGSGSL